jgi:hypothetical protein
VLGEVKDAAAGSQQRPVVLIPPPGAVAAGREGGAAVQGKLGRAGLGAIAGEVTVQDVAASRGESLAAAGTSAEAGEVAAMGAGVAGETVVDKEVSANLASAVRVAVVRAISGRLAQQQQHMELNGSTWNSGAGGTSVQEQASAVGMGQMVRQRFRVQPPGLIAVVRAPPEHLGLAPGGLRKSPSGFAINWSATGGLLALEAQIVGSVNSRARGASEEGEGCGPARQSHFKQLQQQQEVVVVAARDIHSGRECSSVACTGDAGGQYKVVSCPAGKGAHEVTLAAVGLKAGAAKGKGRGKGGRSAGGTGRGVCVGSVNKKLQSRCSSGALVERYVRLVCSCKGLVRLQERLDAVGHEGNVLMGIEGQLTMVGTEGGPGLGNGLQGCKVIGGHGLEGCNLDKAMVKEQVAGEYLAAWEELKSGPVFRGWLPKPPSC